MVEQATVNRLAASSNLAQGAIFSFSTDIIFHVRFRPGEKGRFHYVIMLIYLRDKLRQAGKTYFSKRELSQILSVYGTRVQQGVWRDYAIDCTRDTAAFSIFRSAHEIPLYTVVKTDGGERTKPSQYALYSGKTCLKQSVSLGDVLNYLEEQG